MASDAGQCGSSHLSTCLIKTKTQWRVNTVLPKRREPVPGVVALSGAALVAIHRLRLFVDLGTHNIPLIVSSTSHEASVTQSLSRTREV